MLTTMQKNNIGLWRSALFVGACWFSGLPASGSEAKSHPVTE